MPYPATGPDGVSAVILHKCADAAAVPVAILGRVIVNSGEWRDIWKFHSWVALRKKNFPSDPDNYREVHQTSQIFKVVERFPGQLFAPFLVKTVADGPRQFAYSDAIL